MKNIAISIIICLFLSVNTKSQTVSVDNEFGVPVCKMVWKGKNMPSALAASVEESFQKGTIMQWPLLTNFVMKYEKSLTDYLKGEGSDTELDTYAVYIKSDNGSNLSALFTKDGKLIHFREITKESELPESVVSTIEQSRFKNWKITDDKVRIIDNNNSHVLRYSVLVQKANKKQRLLIDQNGILQKPSVLSLLSLNVF